MKWPIFLCLIGVVFFIVACTDSGTNNEHDFSGPDTVIVLDNFDDNNSQNALGEALGAVKVANMTGADGSWGDGNWYAYASGNGGMVISSDNDTLVDSAGTSESDTVAMNKLMYDGKIYVVLNCQELTGDYWSGIGCDLCGDYEHPYIYDTLKTGYDAIYWDLSSLDSVRVTMRGMGAVLFFFESKAVKDKFPSPDEAWGFHGFSHEFGATMTTVATHTFSVDEFTTTSPEAATVAWADASQAISAFVFELNTELDDRLEIEIDKIEFIGLDTTVAFPFM